MTAEHSGIEWTEATWNPTRVSGEPRAWFTGTPSAASVR